MRIAESTQDLSTKDPRAEKTSIEEKRQKIAGTNEKGVRFIFLIRIINHQNKSDPFYENKSDPFYGKKPAVR